MFASHYFCDDKCCCQCYRQLADDIFQVVEIIINALVMVLFPLTIFLNDQYLPQLINQLQQNNMSGKIIGLIVLNSCKKIMGHLKSCKMYVINYWKKEGKDKQMTVWQKKKIKFFADIISDIISFFESVLSCWILLEAYQYIPTTQSLALGIVAGLAALWRLYSRPRKYCIMYNKMKTDEEISMTAIQAIISGYSVVEKEEDGKEEEVKIPFLSQIISKTTMKENDQN